MIRDEAVSHEASRPENRRDVNSGRSIYENTWFGTMHAKCGKLCPQLIVIRRHHAAVAHSAQIF